MYEQQCLQLAQRQSLKRLQLSTDKNKAWPINHPFIWNDRK